MRLFDFSKFKKVGTYLIELFIVVLGVSIAFQLSVWNDNRKARSIEIDLLTNFQVENRGNLDEMDSSAIRFRNNIITELELIEALKNQNIPIDSAKRSLAELYEISWPSITQTHLKNYLEFTASTSTLREEALLLSSRYAASNVLSENYVEQKQVKYFDFLADVIDMTDNFQIIDAEKLRGAHFRNNLMFISAYEESMAQTLDSIHNSQLRIDSLLKLELNQ